MKTLFPRQALLNQRPIRTKSLPWPAISRMQKGQMPLWLLANGRYATVPLVKKGLLHIIALFTPCVTYVVTSKVCI